MNRLVSAVVVTLRDELAGDAPAKSLASTV
jgi:hypothetical protein